jgi:hypothetical protein
MIARSPVEARKVELRDVLTWQLGLAWSLGELRLAGLTDAECHWAPVPGAWAVREEGGRWRADWVEPEPEPPPGTTVGWLTWHLTWWWGGLVGHALDEPVPPREQVDWPGSAAAAVARIGALHDRWAAILAGADLDRPVAYPWSEPRPLGLAAAWANQELMKNVAEIGQLRDLRAAAM